MAFRLSLTRRKPPLRPLPRLWRKGLATFHLDGHGLSPLGHKADRSAGAQTCTCA